MDPRRDIQTSPHFFKLILDETSRLTKLKIPYRFVNEYGSELSSSATLRLRDGLEWDVEITRCDSKVWFEKGWPNFSKFYSIEHAYTLVFEYQGNSTFGVCICDQTATEIDYSGTLEVDDSSSGPSAVSHLCKRNRNKSSRKLEILLALRRAKDYNPDGPHFIVTIREACSRGGYLHVPSVVTRLYLAKRPTHLLLQTASDEEPWCVGIHYQKSGSRLRAGWPAFLKEHNLLGGDACVFVLKDSKMFLFDVVIYRAT